MTHLSLWDEQSTGKCCIASTMASKGGASARKPGKYFIIRSVSTNHVLSVLGGYGIAGARVVSNPNQDIDDSKLWYEDAISGTIRSKLPSDLVLHCSECRYHGNAISPYIMCDDVAVLTSCFSMRNMVTNEA